MRSSSNNYRRGVEWEREVKRAFERKGWLVLRSAGSRGPFDLACFGNGEVLLIQCKLSRPPSGNEMLRMLSIAHKHFNRWNINCLCLVKRDPRSREFLKNLQEVK